MIKKISEIKKEKSRRQKRAFLSNKKLEKELAKKNSYFLTIEKIRIRDYDKNIESLKTSLSSNFLLSEREIKKMLFFLDKHQKVKKK